MNGESEAAQDSTAPATTAQASQSKASVKWNPDDTVKEWRKQAQQQGRALALRERQRFLMFQYFTAKPAQIGHEQWIAM